MEWLHFLVDSVRPSHDKKIILVLDNHESHKYYPALKYANENHIIFVSFAPHTTHKMQPLDKSVFGPIKNYFEQEINTFQKSYSGHIINQYDVAKIFGPAYSKGATPQYAVSGFKATGLWPLNPFIFGDEEYAPASVTDRPESSTVMEHINSNITEPNCINKPSTSESNNNTQLVLNKSVIETRNAVQINIEPSTPKKKPLQ